MHGNQEINAEKNGRAPIGNCNQHTPPKSLAKQRHNIPQPPTPASPRHIMCSTSRGYCADELHEADSGTHTVVLSFGPYRYSA